MFDGKIGCYPLVTVEQAIRGSHNQLRGEQVIKPIQSITRDVITHKRFHDKSSVASN